jgi:DNA polymerase-3 subunit epsilon
MDFDESDGQGGDGSNLSLGKFDTSVLKVLRASEADQAEHEKYMDVLEKQNKKPPMWREMLNPAAE